MKKRAREAVDRDVADEPVDRRPKRAAQVPVRAGLDASGVRRRNLRTPRDEAVPPEPSEAPPSEKRAKRDAKRHKARKAKTRRVDLEVEVKLRCDSIERFRDAGLDAVEVEERHFEDNWVFKLPDGKLRKGQYLRVRYRGNGDGSGARREGVLTYKGKSKGTGDNLKGKDRGKKVREEIESTVGQPNKVVKIIKRLGLKRSFRYQKYRTVYSVALDDGSTLLAMFDETPIGNFLELEGDSEHIERVARRLGYRAADFLAESYVDMQLARCASRGEPLRDMVFTGRARPGKGSKAP